jgi:hypothetical protein
MKEMKVDYIEDLNKFLCYIKGTKQAYYIQNKKEAISFVKKVNEDIKLGVLFFNSNNVLIKRK